MTAAALSNLKPATGPWHHRSPSHDGTPARGGNADPSQLVGSAIPRGRSMRVFGAASTAAVRWTVVRAR
jgi:hypothetical protein